ncbi:MAG TPA: ChbG/HpnK family deacetylase [Pseudobdellovibrionaceae bacterium]|nr:ChbG/HpnK family deacetylase [Pseudobdellovibrionaceae bacterium]
MKTILHADDFGPSQNISNDILELCREGVVTSLSIMANGAYFEEGSEALKKLAQIPKISIHLNLVEGFPLLKPEEVPHLVSADGEFNNGFGKLWLKHLLMSTQEKAVFESEIKRELRAQILKIQNTFGHDRSYALDSHTHFHLIPFIFRILLELCKEHHISRVRLTLEPFYIHIKSFRDFLNYLSPNIGKFLLLRSLSEWHRSLLIANGITFPQKFIGVLFTGKMSFSVVQTALNKVRTEEDVEILFHPGTLLPQEKYFGSNQQFIKYYQDPTRLKEKHEMCRREWNEIIKEKTP